MAAIRVQTNKSGSDYTARQQGISFRFMLSDGMVTIYTKNRNLGAFKVERFGGALTPESIRAFLESGEK